MRFKDVQVNSAQLTFIVRSETLDTFLSVSSAYRTLFRVIMFHTPAFCFQKKVLKMGVEEEVCIDTYQVFSVLQTHLQRQRLLR